LIFILSKYKRVETGGALVGYYSEQAIVIIHATGPGPRGRRTATSVIVDGEYTTEFCHNLNQLSDGYLYYVGDWHVHHKGILVPSFLDKKASKILIESKASPIPCIAYLIFSTNMENVRAYNMSLETQDEVEIKKCLTPEWVLDFL